VGDSPSTKTNGEGTLGSSFTQPILQRMQMREEHWAVPSLNLSILSKGHLSYSPSIWPDFFAFEFEFSFVEFFNLSRSFNSLKTNSKFLFLEVYAPANIPWPSDVDRFFAWQMREVQRVFAHLQAVLNAGEIQNLFFDFIFVNMQNVAFLHL